MPKYYPQIYFLVDSDQNSDFALFLKWKIILKNMPRLECDQMLISLQTLFGPYLHKYLHHF